MNSNNLNIDDISFVIRIVEEQLNKQNQELVDYMNKYMTQEERNKHGDNISSFLQKPDALKSWISLKMMADGRNCPNLFQQLKL